MKNHLFNNAENLWRTIVAAVGFCLILHLFALQEHVATLSQNEFLCSYTQGTVRFSTKLYWLLWALGVVGALGYLPLTRLSQRAVTALRVCAFVSVAATLFSDRLIYTNHLYLLTLFLGLMSLSPELKSPRPHILWLLKFVWVLPYLFSGLSKVFDAHWFAGDALTEQAQHLGSFMPGLNAWRLATWLAVLVVLFDFLIPTLMMAPRLRKLGLVAVFLFHFASVPLLSIQYFSLLMLAGAGLWFLPVTQPTLAWPGRALFAAFVLVQLLMPLRPYFLSSDPNWTEAHTEFSWRMLNNFKSVNQFELHQQGERIPWQSYFSGGRAKRFVRSPQCILQFSKQWFFEHKQGAAVQGHATCSLNNSLYVRWIPRDVDLSQASLADWTPGPSLLQTR